MIESRRHAGRRLSGDDGAVLVEFAFVFPILTMLLLSMVDLGLIQLGKNVASSAARDGVRVGILDFVAADQAGSSANTAIDAAVRARIVDLVDEDGLAIGVRCVDADTSSTKACTAAAVEVDRDLLEVSVTWRHIGDSPFVPGSTHTDVARMVIVGAPASGAPPSYPCQVSTASASPNPVTRLQNGKLSQNVSITVTTSGSSCGAVTATVLPEDRTVMLSGSSTYTGSFAANGSWTAGVKTVVIAVAGGADTGQTSFTVVDGGDCVLTATVTPATVALSGAWLAEPVTLAVETSDAEVCGAPTFTLLPDEAGLGPDQPMQGSGTSFTATLAAGQGNWTEGTKTAELLAADGTITQVTFTVGSGNCTFTGASANSTSKKSNGTLHDHVTITLTSSGSCATPTFSLAGGPSGFPSSATMGGGATTWTYTIGKTDYSTWTTGTKTVTFSGPGGATYSTTFGVS